MTEIESVLELMMVDDDQESCELLSELFEREKGFKVTTAFDGYDAIDQLAVRLYNNQPLPDFYLCDMLDSRYVIAKILQTHQHTKSEMIRVFPSIAFNVHNYLESKGITPLFFAGCTHTVSDEDEDIARELNMPLLDRMDVITHKCDKLFPNVHGLTRTEAMTKLYEAWSYEGKLCTSYRH